MHYLLFFAGQQYDTGILAKHNLEALTRGGSPDVSQGKGPGDRRGIICTWNHGSGGSHDLSNLGSLEWRSFEVDGVEKPWWLGWDPERPPVPEDLAQKNQIQGNLVTLGDGQNVAPP